MVNAGSYQFIVLCVHEARAGRSMNIPGSPALIAYYLLTACGRKPNVAAVAVDGSPSSDGKNAEATTPANNKKKMYYC